MAADGQREEGEREGLRAAAETESVPLYGTGLAE